MSEYQYYEFLAIDRPLTTDEMAQLRALSTRATITPVSFSNEYNWGDFKGNPDKLMQRYFDAHVYVANWMTAIFMVRLPIEALTEETAKAVAVPYLLDIKATRTHWIITCTLEESKNYDRFGMGPPTILYNRFLVDLVLELGNTVEQNARLFALANLAMADAGIVTWEAKYYYNFWRPITAIREGANDGNSATDGDPDWVPLGAPGGDGPSFTPPFPSYPSGHAAFGAALYQALANFYVTDAMSFSATSEEMPGVVRNYDSFRAAADENGISRIYLGVHWTFDNTEAANLGRNVADYVFAHAGLEENAVDRSWTHYH
ncbi:MAG: PAP2 superfamily protein [candidate division BRC1 bacterium ADurb.BinA292]|nr:MAG: PAP2 superfamily protein [candidate division BRC1 bacterium ADurb.BinA292]